MKLALTVTALLSSLAWPAATLAAPEFVDYRGRPSADIAEITYPYSQVGRRWPIPLAVADRQLCLDNSQNSFAANVDNLGNDNSLVGSRFNVLGQSPGQSQFELLTTITVSDDMIENQCNPAAADPGQVTINPRLGLITPTERQQIKVEFLPPSGPTLETGTAPLYTAFAGQRFRWCPGPGCYRKKSKRVELTIRGPGQMIGMKVYYLWRSSKSKLFRPWRSFTLSERRGQAWARISHRRPRGKWGAYACLDYASNYPNMWVGSPCPGTAISAGQLEKLFPLSTSSRR